MWLRVGAKLPEVKSLSIPFESVNSWKASSSVEAPSQCHQHKRSISELVNSDTVPDGI